MSASVEWDSSRQVEEMGFHTESGGADGITQPGATGSQTTEAEPATATTGPSPPTEMG